MAEYKDKPDFISAKEVARMLGISVKTAYKLWHKGELFGIRIRRTVRFKRSSVEALILSASNVDPIRQTAREMGRRKVGFRHLPPPSSSRN